MFGFGFTEMAVIVLVAVMLFPPRELPKIARGIAKFYGQLRRTADDFRAAILEDEDLNEPIRDIRNVYNEARYEVQRTHEMTQREIAKARMEARMAARKMADSVDPRKMSKELGKGKGKGKKAAAETPAMTEGASAANESSQPRQPGQTPSSTEAHADAPEAAATATEPAAAEQTDPPRTRERVMSATAGSNRPEDAPPSPIRPPRSKLSVPPGLGARRDAGAADRVPSAPPVPGVVPGRVARGESPAAGERPSPAGDGSDDASSDGSGEGSKGVA